MIVVMKNGSPEAELASYPRILHLGLTAEKIIGKHKVLLGRGIRLT